MLSGLVQRDDGGVDLPAQPELSPLTGVGIACVIGESKVITWPRLSVRSGVEPIGIGGAVGWKTRDPVSPAT
ncbi:hypothetical protein [Streptomyces sp. NPDC057293]|uniref:hypothetical protein n=1 Tax=unclassified Streptomyces TaxID=2593676 RepID=UPI0036381BD6